MPTRYLKPGICDSALIDRCSTLAECLFYRLLVNVDDFGRLDARPAVVRAKCFPLKDDISNDVIENLLRELQQNGLIIRYEANGYSYLQFSKWENKARSKVSKCPAPDLTLPASVYIPPTLLPGTGTGTGTGTKAIPQKKSAGKVINSDFDSFWKAYPRKVGKADALKAWVKHKPVLESVLKALEWQVKQEQWRDPQYIPHPATWLNAGQWEDEPVGGKGAVNGKPWFLTASGISNKAKELGMVIGREELLFDFNRKVIKAAGVPDDEVRKALQEFR